MKKFLPKEVKKRSREDAIREANYREAEEGAERVCANCVFRITANDTNRWCNLFDFEFDMGFVCDRHIFRETGF